MRALSTEFAAHIATGATTLSTCWRITRTDGAVLGFTDHDVALTFDGTDFTPAQGADGGEVGAKLGAQVDTSEIAGIVSSAAIAEADILLGRFDGAAVETWRVNWADTSVRHLLRRDTIGEITRTEHMFRAELRSAQHAMNVRKGRVYQPACGARLGDGRCGIDLDQTAYRTTTTVTGVTGRQSVSTELLIGYEENWFAFGTAEWISGSRAGKTDRIATQVTSGGETVLTFAEPVIDWVAAGDTLTVTAGCDRRFATCRAKFDNRTNFRGFPHIPGNDFVLRYPRTGSDFDGAPLFND